MRRSKKTVIVLSLVKDGKVNYDLITDKNRIFFEKEIKDNQLMNYAINILSSINDSTIKEIISKLISNYKKEV